MRKIFCRFEFFRLGTHSRVIDRRKKTARNRRALMGPLPGNGTVKAYKKKLMAKQISIKLAHSQVMTHMTVIVYFYRGSSRSIVTGIHSRVATGKS